MKPRIKLAKTQTPDGGVMELCEHDRDFSITVNGLELMNSRQHESEQELARLGCAHLAGSREARVLIGGLGMGYTLRQALDMLGPEASVVVSELLEDVIGWNRAYLSELNGRALDDKRTDVICGDVYQLIAQSNGRFNAILLDIDNGPFAMTDTGNHKLYDATGIQACRRALCKQGCLAVWSTEASRVFENTLLGSGFKVRRYRVKAYPASHSKPLFIWVAAQEEDSLPPGGEACRPRESAKVVHETSRKVKSTGVKKKR